MQDIMANDDKIINLQEARLKLASKEPPSGNWLSRLPFETRFLAARKSDFSSELHDFLVASDPTQMPAVFLGYALASGNGGFRFVDPVKFSRDYEFFMTIKTIREEDGNSTPVATRAVEGDGEHQVLHEDDAGKS